MGDQMDLPENMTEEDVLEIVRELCGDDMTDEELRTAYRSGMFQELCPDIEQYARQRHGGAKTNEGGNGKSSTDQVKIKSEKGVENVQDGPSKGREEKKTESSSKAVRVKEEVGSESEVSAERHSHHHHKKKKKKHSKDHKKRDKDERKDKERKPKSEHNVVDLADSSDSENERRKKEERHKMEKKKKFISSSDSESDGDRNKHKSVLPIKTEKNTDKKKHSDITIKIEDNDGKPKVHSFYQDKSNEQGVTQPQPSTSKGPQEPKIDKVSVHKEPKPFSKYNTDNSKIRLDRWRPVLHRDHLKYQRKFRLKPVSVVCVDLLDFPMVFHHPRKHSKNPNAVPLSCGVNLSTTRLEMIRRLERDKANWFKKKINRRAQKVLRGKHRRHDSSDDDERKPKRARIMDRILSSSDSNSDSSSIMVPSKKARKDTDDHRERSGRKLSKADKEAEAKRRKLEELKKKVDKFSSKGTRILNWENKDAYFKNNKTKKEDPVKAKEKLIAEKKKRLEQQRQEKLEQLKNAPSVSFQRILKQIESANKEQASRPKVELKIPKKTQNFDRPVPISEYKVDGKIGVGDVYKEVTKLLSRNVLVECPVMPEGGEELGEYTVKKIAWWILKNEKDPPVQGLHHPECHDDEEQESEHEDDFDWPSDVSSINGCVSDPEGVAAEVPPDPKKVADPDWADDYCGEASLYAKFRKETIETKDKQFPIDSVEPFKGFLRVKPGTNYSKPNFEVKCFLCGDVLKGQRQFGAHIRSESHKNNFRNYSLDMANYEEKFIRPTPKKVFTAQLVEYSTTAASMNPSTEKSDSAMETNHQVGKIERVRSDSPGPIVAGDAAPNVIVHQMPIPDDISLPSYEDYDISSDESLMNVKVVIRTAGKWTDDLERRWRTWRDEEAKIAEEYNGERDYFIQDPQRHPSYGDEWLKYWDKKCTELEAEGKDTENYNFDKEWQPVWFGRMQEIMKERVEKRVAELKKSLGIDKHTLRMKYGISADATRRRKKKKKYGKQNEENSSSFKSSDKMESNGHGPSQQPNAPAATHQRTQNNVHSKPTCLPTPPITDENRERDSSNSNDSQAMSYRVKKSESHSRYNKHHKSSNDKHNDRHNRCKDAHSKSNNRDTCRSKRDRKSSRSPDVSNSRINSGNVKNKVESVSSISSVEPSRLGEEPKLLGSSSKAGRPPPPVISERFSKQMTELNKRIESEMNEKLSSRNKSYIPNSEPVSQNSKPRDSREKSDSSNNKRNEFIKSKHVSAWSDESCEEGEVNRGRRDSEGSSGSYSKTLHKRLQSLREALANDEAMTVKKDPPERPKVIPLEKTDGKRNLSDGEVASDISDFKINATQGVSTFVNKEIPGLSDLNKLMPSTSNLNKNSLGYHLLERKKSVDERQTSSHTDRVKHEKRDDRHDKSYRHKDDRHGKQRSHSSRHDDRDRRKTDHRGYKDEKRKWDNNKDNRNHTKDFRGHKDGDRGGGSHDSRHTRDFKQKYNQPPFKDNLNRGPPPTPVVEESWEVDESWEQEPTSAKPAMEEAWAEDSWEPLAAPQLPENTCQIPVLDSASLPRQPEPYDSQHQQGAWNGGWEGNQAYAPHPNSYYNY